MIGKLQIITNSNERWISTSTTRVKQTGFTNYHLIAFPVDMRMPCYARMVTEKTINISAEPKDFPKNLLINWQFAYAVVSEECWSLLTKYVRICCDRLKKYWKQTMISNDIQNIFYPDFRAFCDIDDCLWCIVYVKSYITFYIVWLSAYRQV